jgi:hypothetical protein
VCRTEFAGLPGRATIEVVIAPPEEPGVDAMVMLRGEHDLATLEGVRVALAPLEGDVLVCLAACTFVDASVIGAIVAEAVSRRLAGHRLTLRVDASVYPVRRVLEILFAADGIDGGALALSYVGFERVAPAA